jgi:predicted RNA-binding Zn-ribbon protein involved in translation (DUF1610 family)
VTVMERLTLNSLACPHCGSDLRYTPIPERDRHMYGGKEWFLRSVVISSRELDRAVAVRCPDCGREDSL